MAAIFLGLNVLMQDTDQSKNNIEIWSFVVHCELFKYDSRKHSNVE